MTTDNLERKQPVLVEVLYFDGCPNHAPAVDLVRQVAAEQGVSVRVRQVELTSGDDPEEYRFFGSPTLRVNGVDVEPAAVDRKNFSFSCRVYADGSGLPSKQLVVGAISRAAGSDPTGRASNNIAVNSKRWVLGGSLVAAVLASACCWIPLLLLAFGVSGATLGAGFEPLRPLMIVLTLVFLGAAFYFTYRPSKAAASSSDGRSARVDDCCSVRGQGKARHLNMVSFNKIIMWVVTALAVVLLSFPNYVGFFLAGGEESDATTLGAALDTRETVVAVEGMHCEGCSLLVEKSIAEVSGVFTVKVDYEKKRAVVTTEASLEFPEDAVLNAIKNAGYTGVVHRNK